MHIPKKTKYRKQQKLRNKGIATSGNSVHFGEFGLQAITRGQITARQIEAGRRAINRHIKNTGKTYIRILADKPITKKPVEQKLGKGKAAVEFWAMNIKPGKVIYEIKGADRNLAEMALLKGAAKLPFRCHMIEKIVN